MSVVRFAHAIALSASVGAGLWPAAHAATIAVTNPGFEAPAVVEGVATFATSGTVAIQGWTIFDLGGGGGGGIYNPPAGDAGFPTGAVPDGNNFGYAQSAIVQQSLGVPLAPGHYMLSIRFGNPADRIDMSGPVGFQLFSVPTGNVILSRVGITFVGIPNGTFVDFSASADIFAGNVNLGSEIGIKVVTDSPIFPSGPYYAFDDVRLTVDPLSLAVPLPAGWALFCGGLGLLALRGHRRTRARSRETQLRLPHDLPQGRICPRRAAADSDRHRTGPHKPQMSHDAGYGP